MSADAVLNFNETFPVIVANSCYSNIYVIDGFHVHTETYILHVVSHNYIVSETPHVEQVGNNWLQIRIMEQFQKYFLIVAIFNQYISR